MSEGERQVFAMKLYDDWLEADMADSLEMYCYEQGKADALANKVNMIEDSNFNQQMLKSCTDTSYQCGYEQGKVDQKKEDNEFFNFDKVVEIEKSKSYQQGSREFAEWLCRKSRFEEIDWSGIWDRDEDNKQEFFSIDEVLAEWQKGVENESNIQ